MDGILWRSTVITKNKFQKLFQEAISSNKPTLISCKTIIGYGSPNKSGKSSSHGAPLGDEEIKLVRKKLKWGNDPFVIPKDIKEEWIKIERKEQN